MKLESDWGITAIIMLVKEENLYPTILLFTHYSEKYDTMSQLA